MAKTGREKRLAVAASAMLASLALTGCGYDVQFNGAIFEAMGLANNGGPREGSLTRRLPARKDLATRRFCGTSPART